VNRYFAESDGESFEITACQGQEPTEADVAAFEAIVGFRLPDEFREFTMSRLGGLSMAVGEELRPQAFQVGPAWSFAYGLKVFGIAVEIPDWLDIRVQFQEFREEGFPDLVPFLQIECDADRYCFDRDGESSSGTMNSRICASRSRQASRNCCSRKSASWRVAETGSSAAKTSGSTHLRHFASQSRIVWSQPVDARRSPFGQKAIDVMPRV
jgi:hypothetical protein